MKSVRIGDVTVGHGSPAVVIAEIGINHNGDIGLALRLIDAAATAGCNAVKFQKRTVAVVFSAEDLAKPRESPFGTTNGDLKHGLEFDESEYLAIDRHCRALGIPWFASCWDIDSVEFIERFDPPCHKVASACLTDDELLHRLRRTGRPILLSTGMSSQQQIDHAVEILGKEDLVLLHCTSTYPSKVNELNLNVITSFRRRYGVPVGYSGHEVGLAPTLAAVALGACVIERHLTLDRSLWGSDQSASVEPVGMMRLVKDVRAIESALGDGVKRVYENELPVRDKLRRIG